MTNTPKNDRSTRRPDCVTEIRIGNSVLVVSGYFKQDTTATAADKMLKVLEAEAATQKSAIVKKHFYTLPLYKPPRCMVQSKYGIVGLAVGNGGNHVKTDNPKPYYRPLSEIIP